MEPLKIADVIKQKDMLEDLAKHQMEECEKLNKVIKTLLALDLVSEQALKEVQGLVSKISKKS